MCQVDTISLQEFLFTTEIPLVVAVGKNRFCSRLARLLLFEQGFRFFRRKFKECILLQIKISCKTIDLRKVGLAQPAQSSGNLVS